MFRRYAFINYYGVFARMTTERYEVIIHGYDSTTQEWKEYHLYHKPSDTARAPSWLFMGHLPRIQWMLWFCGLSYHNWTRPLMHRLLTNSPQVLQQFSHNPFPNAPPKKLDCPCGNTILLIGMKGGRRSSGGRENMLVCMMQLWS